MNKELTKKLVDKYPKLFRDIYGDPMNTCMAFGIETYDGWFNLIDRMCQKLQETADRNNEEVYFMQLKTKYAGLRAYINEASDEIHKIIEEAESASCSICEFCGNPGRRVGKGWLYTLCPECEVKNQK